MFNTQSDTKVILSGWRVGLSSSGGTTKTNTFIPGSRTKYFRSQNAKPVVCKAKFFTFTQPLPWVLRSSLLNYDKLINMASCDIGSHLFWCLDHWEIKTTFSKLIHVLVLVLWWCDNRPSGLRFVGFWTGCLTMQWVSVLIVYVSQALIMKIN